jgi:dTDP-4-amino-4,6-dideoxygalactose transaminase
MEWKIPLFKTYWDDDDIDRVAETLKSGMNWAIGPNVQEFESLIENYLGTKYAVVFNSGTSALHALLIAYGIGPGDEIIVPSFTFIATVNAPFFVGAKPVFADIEEKTYGLDPGDVTAKINGRTRAIMPIHYGGSPCLIEELRKIATKHDVLLIEDAAESFGAKWDGKKVGNFGDSAMFSSCQNKVFATGEGGSAVTNDQSIYEKLKLIRSHGRAETADYFSSIEYMDYVTLGYNFRMSNILAALGITQIKKVDRLIEIRRNNAAYMSERLSSISGVEIPEFPTEAFHVYQEYPIRIRAGSQTRDSLQKYLAGQGIMTRISFHPIHLTHYYKNVLSYSSHLPVTEELASRALSLPIYPALTEGDMDLIVSKIDKFFKEET